MIYISNIAQNYFIKLLQKQKKGTNIRIFITNPGTENAECGISYCHQNNVSSKDFEIKFSKFSVFIKKSDLSYFRDAEINFIKNEINSELILKAPYAKYVKHSNKSDFFNRINFFIKEKINPYLANHGGKIFLVSINKKKQAILKFTGGCNGCSMANVTLKNGIEKELLKKFPELTGVKDSTEHLRGEHSYY